jgi:uncharacterized protein (TIGR02058 family)
MERPCCLGKELNGKRRTLFFIEMGTGIDLHGRDVTKAAARAVKDAISCSCLCGLVEVVGLTDLNAMRVDILVGVPHPEQVEEETVMAVVPFGVRPLVFLCLNWVRVHGLRWPTPW